MDNLTLSKPGQASAKAPSELSQSNYFQVLNQTVDSLDVRILVPGIPSEWLRENIGQWREYRDSWFSDPNVPPLLVELPKLGSFRVLPSSLHGREFVLINPEICDIHIWSVDRWSTSMPDHGQLLVSFRSKFLQFVELGQVKEVLDLVEAQLCQVIPLLESVYPRYRRVGRGDLAVDVRRPDPIQWADIDRFVCRATCIEAITTPFEKNWEEAVSRAARSSKAPPKKDNNGGANPKTEKSEVEIIGESLIKEWAAKLQEEQKFKGSASVTWVKAKRKPETIYLGRFASSLYCCTYNKKLAAVVQNKLWLGEVWRQNGWDGSGEVWRTEFRLSGDMLKDCLFFPKGQRDLRELDDFWAAIPALWAYLTSRWLRHVDENENDSHRERWENSAYWDVVSSAWSNDGQVVERDTKLRNPKVDQLERQVVGCIITKAALEARFDGDVQGIRNLSRYLDRIASDPQTVSMINQRRKLFGIDDTSDAAITHLLRRERMKEGMGS